MNRKQGLQIITYITMFLFIFTAFSSTVQSVPPVLEATWIVDISGAGDYTSIKEAINNAAATDIIRIKEGIYKENNININKKITIFGDSPINTIIDFEGNNGFNFISSYVDIHNLKLVNPDEYAIFVSEDSGWCIINNCTIETSKREVGIKIRAPSVVISNSSLIGVDSTGTGIEVQEYNNVIKNCNIYGFTVGVLALVGAHDNEILGCNLFNNEIGVDIRISSHDNLVSECNIYVNDLGVHIWQNSYKNSVYLNNFWKNDVDAEAQGNNTWDNGIKGNYWENYQGTDTNGDGIGETSYTISEENIDKYPLITLILPDKITLPSSIKHVTSASDATPSFIWSPSVYSRGIKGYYVKIDNNPEIYVGDTTSWTSSDIISDGVHAFYVRAEGLDDANSGYASITFSIDTLFIDTDGDGWSDEEEQEYGTDPNNSNNYPLDTDGDRIPNSVDIDDDNDDYSDDMELSYGTNAEDSTDTPIDLDNDGVPDEDSPDGKYVGDIDDDDDSLIDAIETNLGSNPKNGLDAKRVYISGKPYFLVDVSENGVYDILYNQESDDTTGLEKQNESYLLDIDGDGAWDYIYNTVDSSISVYEEEVISPVIILISLLFGIIAVIFVIIFFYKPIRQRILPEKIIKLKKIVLPPTKRKTLEGPPLDKESTKEMIGDTVTLLRNIQKDVTKYLEKLSEIDKQIEVTSTEIDTEKIQPYTKPSETLDIQDIEVEVDRLLSRTKEKQE